MKILLVSPKSKAGNGGFLLGLAYISAVLKENGFNQVSGLDLMYQPESRLYTMVKDADFLGFYCTTRTFREVRRLSRAAKKINPKMTIAVGGPHATLFPDRIIDVESIDIVGIGEGEYTVLDIIQRLSNGRRDLGDVAGIYWKDDGDVKQNPPREVLQNLDLLPFPDWDLFDKTYYYTGLATPIASRGCPFHCINCMPALKKIAGPFRQRSVDNVVKELKYLKTNYDYDHFFFQDNDMAAKKGWLEELCLRILSERLDIRWHALCRVSKLDRSLIKLMKKAGCSHINIGAESGSQRVVNDVLRKGISLEKVREVVQWANEEKIESTVFFMIGIPGETLDEMEETIRFAASLTADDIMVSVSQPVPFTAYEKMCQENHWLLTNDAEDLDTPDDTGGMKCWIHTDSWGPDDLVLIKTKLRGALKKMGLLEIDNKLLFRNFSRILRKRDWAYVSVMIKEEIRKLMKEKQVRPLFWAGYFIFKKIQVSLLK